MFMADAENAWHSTSVTKEYPMTRLPLFALMLAGSAAALPAAAQEAPADADKINQVIIYGDDKCEQSSPDEIVVCNSLPETERYRVPEMLRGDPLDPRNAAWAHQVAALEIVRRFCHNGRAEGGVSEV